MIKAEEIINEKKNKNLTDLEIEYFKANKNPEFKKFTDSINLNDKILMKYTSSLMQCFNEKENCKNCKFYKICKGGCRRNKDFNAMNGEYENYFCKSYRIFFDICLERMIQIVEIIKNQKG